MGDLNKAPNDFFNNLENTKTIRYNSVIQIQIKSLNEKKIVEAMKFEIAQFPEDSQMINQNTIYLGCYETWLHDSSFWKESSVYDAFKLFFNLTIVDNDDSGSINEYILPLVSIIILGVVTIYSLVRLRKTDSKFNLPKWNK